MTPLVLLAGFLGAGKTSFLRQLLPELARRGLRPRVVLNDYENAQLDAASLADLTATLVPINGSCLCCDTQDQLLEALATMPVGPGDVVVVETNGTTDTATLITLLTESAGLVGLSLPIQLTVVDAQRFGTRGWQDTIEFEQIATATHLAVSRADIVTADRFARVQAQACAISPRAIVTTAAEFAGLIAALARSLSAVLDRGDTGHGDTGHADTGHAAAALARVPAAAADGTGHFHQADRNHFASFQAPLPGAVDERAFQRFLQELPAEILRAKGIVMLRQPAGEKRIFHKVGGAVEISPCRLMDEEQLVPMAVFVGVGMPVLTIRSRLARLFSP